LERVFHLCKTKGHHLKWLYGADEPLLHPDPMHIVRSFDRDQGLGVGFATDATQLVRKGRDRTDPGPGADRPRKRIWGRMSRRG